MWPTLQAKWHDKLIVFIVMVNKQPQAGGTTLLHMCAAKFLMADKPQALGIEVRLGLTLVRLEADAQENMSAMEFAAHTKTRATENRRLAEEPALLKNCVFVQSDDPIRRALGNAISRASGMTSHALV